MKILTEYRKARADGATAQRALQSARYRVRMAGEWAACDGGDGEPLIYCGNTPAAMMFDAGDAMAKAARIAECANACQGIADPAGLVRALRTIAGGNGSAAMVARAALGGDA